MALLKEKSGKITKAPKPKPGFAQAQVRFICKNALGIVIAFAALTACLIPVAARLQLHANFLDLLSPNHPSILNLKELMSHVGGTSFLIAVIESPDEKTAQSAAKQFTTRAASFKQAEYVDDRTNFPAFENRKLLFLKLESLEKLQENIKDVIGYYRRKNNPFYIDLGGEKEPVIDVASLELEEKVSKIAGYSAKGKDSFMSVVLMKPKHPVSDFTNTKQLLEEVDAGFAEIKKGFKSPLTLGLTGAYKTRYDEYQTVTHDLRRTGILALVFLLIINLVAFRNFRSLVYAYLPLAIGVVWTWAFTQVTIGYLNLITAFLAAILFGMGGDYTYHILVSFEEDLQLTGNVEKALEMTYDELWHPLWSSMWTTAVVFYAMIISQFEGFRHFGIIAGVGIVISFLVVLYLQPSLIILGEKYFPVKRRLPGEARPVTKRGIYSIIIAGVIFSLFSLTQIPRVGFNYDFTELQAKTEDALKIAEKIGTHFGVHLNPVVFITPNRETSSELARQINRYIDAHPKTLFGFAAAVTSHVPREQDKKIAVLGEMDLLFQKHQAVIQKLDHAKQKDIAALRQQLKPEPFGLEDLPEGLRGQYEGTDRKISTVFIYPNTRILDGRVAKRFVKEARDFPVREGVKLAGEPVIYSDILMLLERDSPIAIGLSVITVFLLVFLHFKRLDHVLWVHIPLVIGILWMVGMMGLTGLKFNFFNMVVIPSVLGVGIDNGIYIFDRYKERKSENFVKSMSKSIKGVLLSSATNISGFASLMFASHVGMSSIGKLGVFGFLGCLLSSVFFLPALIEFSEKKFAHRFRRSAKS